VTASAARATAIKEYFMLRDLCDGYRHSKDVAYRGGELEQWRFSTFIYPKEPYGPVLERNYRNMPASPQDPKCQDRLRMWILWDLLSSADTILAHCLIFLTPSILTPISKSEKGNDDHTSEIGCSFFPSAWCNRSHRHWEALWLLTGH